jgi:transcriptional activator of cad operon
MEHPTSTKLCIGDWRLDRISGDLSRGAETARLDARSLRLLLCLADRAGEVVSIDELLRHVWSEAMVTPDSVYQAITSLRRVLGDDAKQPVYIATVPRLGYRMVAKVSVGSENPATCDLDPPIHQPGRETTSGRESSEAVQTPTQSSRVRAVLLVAAIAMLCLSAAIAAWAFLLHRRAAATREQVPGANAAPSLSSIAVLPFLDLTEGMKNEEFADGITEELIDKLSRVPGTRVPSPTSSFYFKDKKMPIAEIANSLGVAYVLDGSVRKSGTWVRVDVRLVRAENGYIAWSATYDQPMSDILTIQDDIANKVIHALQASIGAEPAGPAPR